MQIRCAATVYYGSQCVLIECLRFVSSNYAYAAFYFAKKKKMICLILSLDNGMNVDHAVIIE